HISSRSVDHRVFVLKQHFLPPDGLSVTTLNMGSGREQRLPSQMGATASLLKEPVQFGPHPLH
ncbi:MAG TPA: hypothetical protein VH593_23320, partial [Ktedonobacteraceae bacterium]